MKKELKEIMKDMQNYATSNGSLLPTYVYDFIMAQADRIAYVLEEFDEFEE